MEDRHSEVATKIAYIRNRLGSTATLRLRGSDWFAWITAGGSNNVLLSQEYLIAEVLITPSEAWVLTDEVDARRLLDEELPDNFQVFRGRWSAPSERDEMIRDSVGASQIYSDRPASGEQPIPPDMLQIRRQLMACEIERYRQVGQLASDAMYDVMMAAKPTWTERELAAAGAQALLQRGLEPVLTLAAGARRMLLYRHATPTAEPLERMAMLTLSARGHGLYANLTRTVCFDRLSGQEQELHAIVRLIESEALACTKPGIRLDQVYQILDSAYRYHGFENAIEQFHQGGTTGYLHRDIVASPLTNHTLDKCEVVAWNPSLPGARIEDTFLISCHNGLENLTLGSKWPTVEVEGRPRPVVLER
jgi:Xaa-Pro aminopeptidase